MVEIEAEWNAGMISTLAGPDSRHERIGRGRLRIERDVGRHLAVVFEIDPALVEDLHRLDDMRRALAGRMAEGRERQQREPRLVAHAAGDAGGLDRDVGKVLGVAASR